MIQAEMSGWTDRAKRIFGKLEIETEEAARKFTKATYESKILVWGFFIFFIAGVGFSIWQNVRISNLENMTYQEYFGLGVKEKYLEYVKAHQPPKQK